MSATLQRGDAATAWLRRAALGCSLAVVAAAAVGCTSSAAHHAASSSGSGGSSTVAARWWSNSAAHVGSTIDKGHADAAVAKLHQSRADYCGMIRQTAAAGKTILPGVAAADPALISTMIAFVSELQKVAPNEVAADWQVIGKAVMTLVKSGGTAPKTPQVDGAAIQKAAAAVAADAEKNCHVDLSA